MVANPFDSPRLLISHARDEIEDAEGRLKVFFESKPYTRVIDLDRETDQEVHKFRLTAGLPGKINAVVKDAAANLRDALDHAVYACAVSFYSGDPASTGFPFAKDDAGVNGELGGKRLSGNPPEIRPFLRGLQPHEGGNDLLWGLNSIRNPNTHRVIVPVMAAISSPFLKANAIVSRGGMRIGYSAWDATKNEVEYMRLGRGSYFDYEVQITCGATFDGTNALSGKPVIPTLREIAAEVEGVVSGIEAETARFLRERTV